MQLPHVWLLTMACCLSLCTLPQSLSKYYKPCYLQPVTLLQYSSVKVCILRISKRCSVSP